MINKFILFIFSLFLIYKKKVCPNCNFLIKKNLLIIDKKFNLKLIECPKCYLRFLHPNPINLSKFYYDFIYKDSHTTSINSNYLDYLTKNINTDVDFAFKNKISRYSNIYIELFNKIYSMKNSEIIFIGKKIA